MNIRISDSKEIDFDQVVLLYKSNEWSSADKPALLTSALLGSHSLVTAWDGGRLVGLGNSISDGHLVLDYPHLLALPKYQGKGIGHLIVAKMQDIYREFHMKMLNTDGKSIEFYEKVGFEKAGETISMWKYSGIEH